MQMDLSKNEAILALVKWETPGGGVGSGFKPSFLQGSK